ncbi:recombinase-like helix-turn-helix domain-containing protein [Novosphingobium rosa]|uniref:recombinase-like helix-turn-helix domain-containing protein n=1 Tax=Novosphingobium rosa TaxID=76978 RepID=UPI000831D64D|nr:recombinase-like helix-turn-helix domain-containing protein [Novosphingobium rosa]
MYQHNPWLAPDRHRDNKGDTRTIESATGSPNIVFQTRGAPLSPFEDGLADALMAVFDDGAVELDEVVAGLNARGITDAEGQSWTPESLAACLKTLGDALFAKEA